MKGISQINDSKVMKNSTGKYDLHRDFVDDGFHDPYIISGYRKPYMTAFECIRSAFILSCNESFNILSHFGAFTYLAIKYYRLFTTEISMDEPLHWPLFCQSIGVLGFCLMSAIAHTFNAMSPSARNRCFFLDYAAISIYSVGAGIAFYFYERPLNSYSSLSSPQTFISISIATSLVSTWLCCTSRTKWTSVKYLVRTLSYVLPFLVNSFPLYYRLILCDNELDCEATNFPIYLKHALYQLIAAIVNVTKFPERFLPGKFDALGQSHHIMHVLFPYACDTKFEFLRLDIAQKSELLKQNVIQPDAYNTLGAMVIAIALNLAIALFLNADSKKKGKQN